MKGSKNQFWIITAVCLALIITGCAGDDEQGSPSQSDDGYINNQSVLDHGIYDESSGEHSEDYVETLSSGSGFNFGELKSNANMINTNNEKIGQVSFYALDDQMVVKAEAKGLEPGFHGFHIHQNGVCEPDAAEGPFMSAGDHYNPGGTDHSKHTGDMPPLYVASDSTAFLVAKLDRFTPQQLVDDNVAVIIHEKADNFANIPDRYQSTEQDTPGPDEETLRTGDSGDRASCGVVEGA
ncbi:superoxide dismutase family protein [Alteribacter populi]|uniref:superoxide dismutase family protein n=1 Tax=Alteribacter populi TaxID=2011011 RepID=UPI000BBA415C|nr:superoxide dismutase family protein [Alteribacter populi]